MADPVRRLSDTRIWQFRKTKGALANGGEPLIEKRLFPSRADIPEGEGWFDSAPEAQAGQKLAPVKREKTPDEMTVEEQVAALEAKAAKKTAKVSPGK